MNGRLLGLVPLQKRFLGQRLPSGYQLYNPGFQNTVIPGRLPTGYQELEQEETVQIIAPPKPGYVPPEPEPSTITTPDFQPGDTVQIISPPYRPPYQLPPDISSLTEAEYQEMLEAISSNRPLIPSGQTQTPPAAYVAPGGATPPPIETLPMVPSVDPYKPGGITPQNVVTDTGPGVFEPPVPPPRYPTGPRYTDTPPRPVTEYEPELQRQIESYEQSRAEFESRPATASQYEGRMTPQEIAAEAARRHQEWVQKAGIDPGEMASIDCGPGMFWDGKQCRGSRPPGGMSQWVSAGLTLGPSGASVAQPPPPPPTGSGGYGGYQLPPPPPPSGPIFGPNIMTGRVLGRRFPVVNL